MTATSIDCLRLKKLLRKEGTRCLVVDCRPYLSFLSSSIRGSLNANLNSVLVRRYKSGPVPLHFIIPDELTRARLREPGRVSVVVVLDQCSPHCHKVKKDSAARLVLNTLTSCLRGPQVRFLKGGYEHFYSQYPEFCTELRPNVENGSETDKNHSSRCEKVNSSHKPAYDQGSPVEILPYLYLGSAYHASSMECLIKLSITALLNVSQDCTRPFNSQLHYKWIPVDDSHTADISSHFQEAFEFIDCVRRAGGRVLVHCEAGISRSPTICMAYLMKTMKLCLDEAFDYIKQRRSIISPNFSFMGQLQQYELEVISSTPSTPVASCKRETVFYFTEEIPLNKVSHDKIPLMCNIMVSD